MDADEVELESMRFTRNANAASKKEEEEDDENQQQLTRRQREFLNRVASIYSELAEEEPDTPEAASRVASASSAACCNRGKTSSVNTATLFAFAAWSFNARSSATRSERRPPP